MVVDTPVSNPAMTTASIMSAAPSFRFTPVGRAGPPLGRCVPAPHEEAIFERFWRGHDPDSPGSGLGLAIVRAIAERHQGRVIVDGARFTIDLPAVRSAHVLAEDTPDRQ